MGFPGQRSSMERPVIELVKDTDDCWISGRVYSVELSRQEHCCLHPASLEVSTKL